MKLNIQLVLMLVVAGWLSSCTTDTAGNETILKTESGQEYITYKPLSKAIPSPGDFVFFQVQMRSDSAVIDGSRMRGGQIPRIQIPKEEVPGRRVSPIEELLKTMGVGDSVTLIVNLDTVPVNQRPPGFQNHDVMYYDVVCTDIQKQADYEAKMEVERKEAAEKAAVLQARKPEIEKAVADALASYKAGTANVKTTSTGLKYLILKEGDGAQAAAGKTVSVHYYGSLLDGTMFDNSFDRGEPITFPLGQKQVIPGWEEGLALLKAGSTAVFFIPSDLAYGDRATGKIPANAELMFYIELEDVK